MRLLITADSILGGDAFKNGTFRTESGQVLYKVKTPIGMTSSRSTIYRSIASLPPPSSDQQPYEVDKEYEGVKFIKIAEIEFNTFSPTIFHLRGGMACSEYDLFGDGGTFNSFTYLNRDRAFTGPDGEGYVWTLHTSRGAELFLDNPQRPPVAILHRRKFGIFHDPSPPIFEIYPVGEHIMDNVFITFIFAQTLVKRREHQRLQRSQANSMMGGMGGMGGVGGR